jgi:hypothetical protein
MAVDRSSPKVDRKWPNIHHSSEWDSCQLFINFKKAYDSVRKEVLSKFTNEFGVIKKASAN